MGGVIQSPNNENMTKVSNVNISRANENRNVQQVLYDMGVITYDHPGNCITSY